MSARGTITSAAVVSRSRSTLAISSRSCRSSSGGSPGSTWASAASCTSSAIESRRDCSACRRPSSPRSRVHSPGRMPCPAHARFHGLGTPSRCRIRASACSIRRASPAWWWSWPARCSAPCTTRCARWCAGRRRGGGGLAAHHAQRQDDLRRRRGHRSAHWSACCGRDGARSAAAPSGRRPAPRCRPPPPHAPHGRPPPPPGAPAGARPARRRSPQRSGSPLARGIYFPMVP